VSWHFRNIFIPSPIVFFILKSDWFSGLLNRTIDSDIKVLNHVLLTLASAHDKQKSKYFANNKSVESQALVSFKKYMPPPLPYFKVNICPFPLPHFASIFFRLFVILSLTQLYRYTPEIFLFSTATFKYTYRAPLRRIGQEYSVNIAWSTFQSLKRIQPLPVWSKLI
jgi:hypothetical protein